jgi:hypothetical protein
VEGVSENGPSRTSAVNTRATISNSSWENSVGGLVRTALVHHRVRAEFFRHRGVDCAQELGELRTVRTAMAAMQLANDFTCDDVEHGRQRRCSVANVVVHPLLRHHRQCRLRAIVRLDLAFLIDARYQ